MESIHVEQDMSDKLRHFTSQDPPGADKAEEREKLARDVAEYLAKGNEIETVPEGESAGKHYPVKRSRKSQVNFIRRRSFNRRQE